MCFAFVGRYKHPGKESVKERPSWLSKRLILIQWSSRKCLKRKVKMKILSWPNYLPQTRVSYQTQHPYWNRTVVGTSQYFQSSPLQIYATIFWERLTSTLKEPLNLLKALRVINCSKMDMFWTSSSWRRTFTFRKRSIRTIRVTFRCCLFLTAKVRVIMVYWSCLSTKVHASLYGVLNIELSGTNFLGLRLLITLSLPIGKTLRTRTNSIRWFLWVKDSRIAVRTYTFSTRNWNLDVTFLKM